MAAAREGITCIIFPKSNQKDVEKLPKYIKEGITFLYAEEYKDVFKIMFPNVKINK